MASIPSHSVAALGLGALFYRRGTPKGVWVTGAICSVVPDLDVIGFHFGVHYGDFWGHRGFTHSLWFAALIASAAFLAFFRSDVPGISRFALWTYLFVATVSHGVLDAMTDGGLGVAFFSPLDNSRYFLPWRPIHVSPIGVMRFFSYRGLEVLRSEALFIWMPSILLILVVWFPWRRREPLPKG